MKYLKKINEYNSKDTYKEHLDILLSVYKTIVSGIEFFIEKEDLNIFYTFDRTAVMADLDNGEHDHKTVFYIYHEYDEYNDYYEGIKMFHKMYQELQLSEYKFDFEMKLSEWDMKDVLKLEKYIEKNFEMIGSYMNGRIHFEYPMSKYLNIINNKYKKINT